MVLDQLRGKLIVILNLISFVHLSFASCFISPNNLTVGTHMKMEKNISFGP